MGFPEYHPFKSAEAKEMYLQAYDALAQQWSVPAETRMVDTSYGQTLVRISGPEDAPSLVLLHGLGGNSLAFAIESRAEAQLRQNNCVNN